MSSKLEMRLFVIIAERIKIEIVLVLGVYISDNVHLYSQHLT